MLFLSVIVSLTDFGISSISRGLFVSVDVRNSTTTKFPFITTSPVVKPACNYLVKSKSLCLSDDKWVFKTGRDTINMHATSYYPALRTQSHFQDKNALPLERNHLLTPFSSLFLFLTCNFFLHLFVNMEETASTDKCKHPPSMRLNIKLIFM